MNLPDAPIAHEGFFATHFFTVSDQDKSKDFYVRILGGKLIKPDNPCYIKLANTWIILNSGGGPTPDKPEVFLETPSDLNRVNSLLNLRVADISISRSLPIALVGKEFPLIENIVIEPCGHIDSCPRCGYQAAISYGRFICT
jgi:hypothetical protein